MLRTVSRTQAGSLCYEPFPECRLEAYATNPIVRGSPAVDNEDMDEKPFPARGCSWLRRADQAAVAALVGIALAATVAWWAWQGGLRGRLIELDRSQPASVRFTVDVNRAGWAELAEIPGVGPALAQRIIDYRRTSGPFKDLAELRRVRGIGPTTFQRMGPYLQPLPGHSTLAGN